MNIQLEITPARENKPDGFETLLAEGIESRTEFVVYVDQGGPNLVDPSMLDKAGLIFIISGKKHFISATQIAAAIIKGERHANANNPPALDHAPCGDMATQALRS